MQTAMGKQVADVALRVWTPQHATVRFVKQVAPTVEDLTGRRTQSGPQAGDYPTGAWGAEREPRLPRLRRGQRRPAVGQEMLAARVSLVASSPSGPEVLGQGLVRAIWTDDEALSTRINAHVAHYTGQAELAQVIQEGLEARKQGDEDTATAKLGRAVALAEQSGNEDTAKLLAKVVDVVDAATGHRAAEEEGRRRRRDGARHQVNQDGPDQEVAARRRMPTCPAGHDSGEPRFLRRMRDAHRRIGAGSRRRRPRPRRAPSRPDSACPRPPPAAATPGQDSSARPAGSTSPSASQPRRHTAPAPARPPLRPEPARPPRQPATSRSGHGHAPCRPLQSPPDPASPHPAPPAPLGRARPLGPARLAGPVAPRERPRPVPAGPLDGGGDRGPRLLRPGASRRAARTGPP